MKWERAVPQQGDRRVRTRFAWWPKTMRVDGKLDVTVWLERYVEYEQYGSVLKKGSFVLAWGYQGSNTLTGHLTDKLNGKDWVAEGKQQAAPQAGQASLSSMLTQINQQVMQQYYGQQTQQQTQQLQLPFGYKIVGVP